LACLPGGRFSASDLEFKPLVSPADKVDMTATKKQRNSEINHSYPNMQPGVASM